MIKPGILENSIKEINNKLDLVDANTFQIDIADGLLVNGKTLTNPQEFLKIKANKLLELHLMVKNPTDYIVQESNIFKMVIAHVEAEEIQSFIDKASATKTKVGLSINLETPISALEPYIQQIDLVQFMAIEPGGQGRPFEPKVLEKIKEFKLKHTGIQTQVDGHMNEGTIPTIKLIGVDHVIVGSAIFNDANPQEKYNQLKNLFESK